MNMKNLLLVYEKNNYYYVKNNHNGSIIKLNYENYEKMITKDKTFCDYLVNNKFLVEDFNLNNELNIFLLVDNFCNLNCPYCFETKKSKQ